MILWIIIGAVLVGVSLILILLLAIKKFLKNKYNFSYEKDSIIRVNKETDKNVDFVFIPRGSVFEYVKEYIISKRGKKKELILEYNEVNGPIKYYVVAFGANKKVLQVTEVTDKSPSKYSRIIKLHKKTKAVNIVVREANYNYVELPYIRPLSLARIFIFSFIISLIILCLSFASRIALTYFFSSYKENYLQTYLTRDISVSAISSFVAFVLIFIILSIKRKRMGKMKGADV